MPPRYAYWTILAGGLPTAFRAALKEDLLPTFQRIRQKHPDAELRYFARGKLWSSPEEARGASQARHRDDSGTRRPETPRDRSWRPGGEHRDPRQKFRDEKRARNQDRRQRRFDAKQERPPHRTTQYSKPQGRRTVSDARDRRAPRPKPHGDRMRDQVVQRPPAKPSRRLQPKSSRRDQNQEIPPRPEPVRTPEYEVPPQPDRPSEPPPKPAEPVIPPPAPERGRRKR